MEAIHLDVETTPTPIPRRSKAPLTSLVGMAKVPLYFQGRSITVPVAYKEIVLDLI